MQVVIMLCLKCSICRHSISYLVASGCVVIGARDCGGPVGSAGRGEPLRLSRQGELLLGETSLLVQLLVEE